MANVPAGFVEVDPMDRVMGAFAPIYLRRMEGNSLDLGFRVGPHHCNPRGACHGGVWSTMADLIMGFNIAYVTGLGGPTVSLSIDFLDAALEGNWVEGSARVLRWTDRLAFVDCTFSADGKPALRGSAIFRRRVAPLRDIETLLGQDRHTG